MLRVLVIILSPNGVTGLSLSTGELQISFVVSSSVLVRRVRGASGDGLRSRAGWCCRPPLAPS